MLAISFFNQLKYIDFFFQVIPSFTLEFQLPQVSCLISVKELFSLQEIYQINEVKPYNEISDKE